MKRLLSYLLASSSPILFISCDSSETDKASATKNDSLLEVHWHGNQVAAEEEVVTVDPEPLPLVAPLPVVETRESPEAVVDYEYFHETLAPLGTWYETDEYGPVWQPLASREANWAPYTRGKWIYCDQGWAWVSSEQFGWVTYHYGRWAKLEMQGWVWVPGTEWAPSWCSWRSNDSYIGWAPLPPETLAFSGDGWDSIANSRFGVAASCYNFVRLDHFDRSIFSHCLPFSQTLSCFDATNDISGIRFLNNRIYCGGPRYRDLSGRLGRRLPFCQLRPSRDFSRKALSVRLKNRVDGDDLIVNTPKVRATGLLQTRSQQIPVRVQRGKDADPRVIEAFRRMREREVTAGRNRVSAQDADKRTTRPTATTPRSRPRVVGEQPSSRAEIEAAAKRKVQAETNRRHEQEAVARRRALIQKETAQREAARKSVREAMQRQQREAAQREQEEEERRERIAGEKRQRENARRKEEAEEQRKRIEAQRKAREEMERRQREEAKRRQEAEEKRRRIEEERKEREEADRRRREEEAAKERRRIEEERKQREEAERRRQEEERRRIEEEKRSREEARRKEREEAERQREKENSTRRREK